MRASHRVEFQKLINLKQFGKNERKREGLGKSEDEGRYEPERWSLMP
jgi:hypothetical protein